MEIIKSLKEKKSEDVLGPHMEKLPHFFPGKITSLKIRVE